MGAAPFGRSIEGADSVKDPHSIEGADSVKDTHSIHGA
jgi:hypothetical protein